MAEERCERSVGGRGSSIGHSVRGDQKLPCENESILFATNGTAFHLLHSNSFTHLVVDEANERRLDADLLLLIAKLHLEAGAGMKLILLSANLNFTIFQDYYAAHQTSTLSIEGVTWPVRHLFLDSPGVPKFKDFTPASVIKIFLDWAKTENDGSALIFLDDTQEIEDLSKTIQTHDFIVYPLHAKLSTDKQAVALSESGSTRDDPSTLHFPHRRPIVLTRNLLSCGANSHHCYN